MLYNFYPKYSPKVLEMVSKEISKYFTGREVLKILTNFGVARDNIEYPNTKWWIINEAFKYIQTNFENHDSSVSEIIMVFMHPTNHNLNEEIIEKLADQIKKYIKYDNLHVEKYGTQYVIMSSNELDEFHEPEITDLIHDDINKKQDIKTIKQNKSKVKLLRDYHQVYMDTLEIFCKDTKKPSKELNDAYLFLTDKIEWLTGQLSLDYYLKAFYKPFKKDLYSAEFEWNGDGSLDNMKYNPKLSWDAIRPNLYKIHSDIVKINSIAEEDEKMTDDDKILEGINNLISARRTQDDVKKEPQNTMKVEITKLPDLNVKNIEENTVVKNKKRISLPKFNPTDWNKIEIRFIDENTLYIKAGNKTSTADYESLGFSNEKSDKPNTAWFFLLELAKNGGETPIIKSPIPDNIKQQKRIISDRLKVMFKNDTEPFEEFSITNTYKIKIKLTPPNQVENPDKLGVNNYLEEMMPSV